MPRHPFARSRCPTCRSSPRRTASSTNCRISRGEVCLRSIVAPLSSVQSQGPLCVHCSLCMVSRIASTGPLASLQRRTALASPASQLSVSSLGVAACGRLSCVAHSSAVQVTKGAPIAPAEQSPSMRSLRCQLWPFLAPPEAAMLANRHLRHSSLLRPWISDAYVPCGIRPAVTMCRVAWPPPAFRSRCTLPHLACIAWRRLRAALLLVHCFLVLPAA